MSRQDILRRTLAAALATAGAASAWWRLLDTSAVLSRIVPSVFFVAATFWIGTAGGKKVARGLGAVLALVGTVLAALIFGALTLDDSQGQITPSATLTGLVSGLGILLHSPVPAPVDSETVSAAIIFTGYACAVSCLLFCTKTPALGLIPPFLLYLGATALGQGSVESPVNTAATFIATSLVALALVPNGGGHGTITDGVEFAEATKGPRQGRVMSIITVLVLSGLAAAAAVLLGQMVGLADQREPWDPHQQKSYMPKTEIDPIVQVNRWQTSQRALRDPLMTVAGNELPKALTWAIAESYTGKGWQTLKAYDNTDGDIPYVGPAPNLTRKVAAVVATTNALPGPWLPTAFRVTNVSGVLIRANAAGVVLARSDNAQNVTYSPTSTVLALPSLSILTTTKSAETGAAVDKELPMTFPSSLQDFADSTTRGADNDFQKLTLLAERLSTIPYAKTVNATSADLLTYSSITDLVLSSHRGTQSQFATAFALLARSQGFPTRMAAGFAISPDKGGAITTRQAIVWPEVNLTKVGWVAFAPGPGDLATGVPVPVPYKAPPTPKPTPSPPPPPPTPAPSPPTEPADAGPSAFVLAIAAGIGGCAVWVLLVTFIRIRLRRRLQTDSNPSQSVAGAWVWFRSASAHLRMPVPMSPRAVIEDDDASADLSALANASESALYGPDQAEPTTADLAWVIADRQVSSIVAAAGLRGRMRWWLVPLRSIADGSNHRGDPTGGSTGIDIL